MAYVPDGFEAESFSDGINWRVMTRVTEMGLVQWKCFQNNDPTRTSDWETSPSRAYELANQNNPKYKAGANGRIVFGITYPAAQKRLREVYGDLIERNLVPPPHHGSRSTNSSNSAAAAAANGSTRTVSKVPRTKDSERKRKNSPSVQDIDALSATVPDGRGAHQLTTETASTDHHSSTSSSSSSSQFYRQAPLVPFRFTRPIRPIEAHILFPGDHRAGGPSPPQAELRAEPDEECGLFFLGTLGTNENPYEQ